MSQPAVDDPLCSHLCCADMPPTHTHVKNVNTLYGAVIKFSEYTYMYTYVSSEAKHFKLPQEVQSLVSLAIKGELKHALISISTCISIGIPAEAIIGYGSAKEFEAVHYLNTLAINTQGIQRGLIPMEVYIALVLERLIKI